MAMRIDPEGNIGRVFNFLEDIIQNDLVGLGLLLGAGAPCSL